MRSLSSKLSLAGGLLTFILCSLYGISISISLFRGVVVFIFISITILIFKLLYWKVIEPVVEELKQKES